MTGIVTLHLEVHAEGRHAPKPVRAWVQSILGGRSWIGFASIRLVDHDYVRCRLAALAAADPAFTRFGAHRHRYRLGPALSQEDVAAFERLQGVTLPESYRRFLTEVGDGGAGPFYGLFRLDGSDMRDLDREERETAGFLATPFPHIEAWNPHRQPSDAWMDDEEYFHPRWVSGSLIIAEFGCGAFFRLVVTGPVRGRAWFDDRASDGGLTPGHDFGDWYLRWLDDPH